MTAQETSRLNEHNYLMAIRDGNDLQFVFNTDNAQVYCRCGHAAVWWKTAFICGTITAYPCRYNNDSYSHDLAAVKAYYEKVKGY